MFWTEPVIFLPGLIIGSLVGVVLSWHLEGMDKLRLIGEYAMAGFLGSIAGLVLTLPCGVLLTMEGETIAYIGPIIFVPLWTVIAIVVNYKRIRR